MIDIEIRSVYRNSEDLALSRGEAAISGFEKDDFDVLFFDSAVCRKIKAAYHVDSLYSINCALWLLAFRTITALIEFSKFSTRDKELTLQSLDLNWMGPI